MDIIQEKCYPPPPEYAQVFAGQEQAIEINPTPYDTNNTRNGIFSKPMGRSSQQLEHPGEVVVPLSHHTNSHQQFEENPPMYNPGFKTPHISQPASPEMVFPQPTLFPSQKPIITHGMMPPLKYSQDCSFPGPVFYAPNPPMVVTTQTTVTSNQPRNYRDYLPWSIFNLVCCCLIFGIVAVIYSNQTRSAKRYQDWEKAKKSSCLALAFNITSTILGIAIIVIIPTVYYTQYYAYYNSYYNNLYYNYNHNNNYYG